MSEELFGVERSTGFPERADVVIVGGGIVGLALAFELQRRGAETVVLERGRVAARETSALGCAAGMVNPQANPGVEPEPVRDLSLLARHLYADWVATIEEDAGLPCEYDTRGGLTVALSDAEEVALDRALDWQRARALPFEVLAAEEARAREPRLGPDVRAAFAFSQDGQIAPARLGQALLLAARSRGALVLEHVPALGVVVESGRAIGVETPNGRILADAVVNAGGAYSASLRGVPPLPIVPVRGQMVSLDASADGERLSRFVHGVGVYLVPRRDGSLVVGSTLERAGFDARPTSAGVSGLLLRAASIVPVTADYAVLETWSGLRPASPDGIPILGETSIPGYHLAAGHFKNGVLMAPASAVLVASLLARERPPLPETPFSPARFDL